MAIIKGTMIFEGGAFGWQENLFWTGSASNLNAATAALDFIAQKRAPLLGAEQFIKARRVSVELDEALLPVRGDAQLRKLPIYVGTPTQPSVLPGTCVQLRHENPNGTKHRNTFLHGVWDIIESSDGVYVPGAGPGWGGFMSAYLSALLGAAGVITGWLSRTNTAPDGAQVVNYQEDESGQITFTTTANVFASGDVGKRRHIRISGINAPNRSSLNGEWVVKVLSTSTCQTIIPVSAFPFVTSGKILAFTYAFQPATTIIEENMAFKSVGRPTLVRRGRAARRPRG